MFCALLLPQFPLQAALRHRPTLWRTPVAVVGEERLLEVTDPAKAAGVLPGLTPVQGMARSPQLLILSRCPATEDALSRLLLQQASAASAWIEATAPAMVTLDLTAAPHGTTPEAAAQQLIATLHSLELRAHAGLAATPDLALLAARAATPEEPLRIIQNQNDFLDPLPIEALDPSESSAAILRQWGIRTLHQLRQLKRQALADRLGPEGRLLHDRATGRAQRLLRLTRPPEHFEERFDFERELDTAQPLLFLLRRFVDQLTQRLDALGLVAAEMTLSLPLSQGDPYHHTFQIPSPTARAETLFRMLETHFEPLRLDHGPTAVALSLQATRPERAQFRLFESTLRDPNRFAETLARLGALTGNGCVGTPERLATHQPDQFKLIPPNFSSATTVTVGDNAHPPPIGLPLRRFRPPRPAQVTLRQAHPIHLTSEGWSGPIVECLGPYLLSGQWWEPGRSEWQREEWDVQLGNGALLRLSRHSPAASPAWYLEGCYDHQPPGVHALP